MSATSTAPPSCVSYQSRHQPPSDALLISISNHALAAVGQAINLQPAHEPMQGALLFVVAGFSHEHMHTHTHTHALPNTQTKSHMHTDISKQRYMRARLHIVHKHKYTRPRACAVNRPVWQVEYGITSSAYSSSFSAACKCQGTYGIKSIYKVCAARRYERPLMQ
jgi:predicted NAD/FAD-dependent oxidoreductase